MMRKTFITFIILLLTSITSGDFRQSQLLNGTWQAVIGKGISELPTEGWTDFDVPGKSDSYADGGARYQWTRRGIEIPESWNGHRIFVTLNSARFNPHVYIDGKLIAERMDGWTPLEVEITNTVKAGSKHWLQIRCQGKSATFADGFVLQPGQGDEALRGKILAPVGGHHMFYGTWDDVFLHSKPETYVDDVVIIPSTRKNTLTIKGVVSGTDKTGVWVKAEVLDKNKKVLEIAAADVREQGKWELSESFPKAEYWSPENPHLYQLRIILGKDKPGNVLDISEHRFGFREFWTQGPDFYLNGAKRHLLASSTWPTGGYVQSRDHIRKTLEMIKAGNNIAFRYHTAPWPKRWVELADEVGLLIICEAAFYTDQVGMYAYQDERFWKNYREHIEGMIKRDRNNPSVIMWSIENELLFMGMDQHAPNLARKLGDMGRFAKKLDPYRPIMFDGDYDPDGAADVIGLHYPHELPTYADWPNTADWLDKKTETEAGGGMLGRTTASFFWDRQKPLYIGEYLWVPSEDYAAGTIFYGDQAYLDRQKYHAKAKLQAWIYQSIAYRRAGVSGICPWSCFRHGIIVDDTTRPLYEAQRIFFRPVAAFLRNQDTRFFAGEKVERTYDVFNDSPEEKNLFLKWALGYGEISGQKQFKLEAGGHKVVTISFVAPQIKLSETLEFETILIADDRQVHKTRTQFTIVKRQEVMPPKETQILLYDPQNTFSSKMSFAKRIDSLKNLNQFDKQKTILVIAPGALTKTESDDNIVKIGGSEFDTGNFRSFVNKGGRVLVLEQNNLQPLGLGGALIEKASTMTFSINSQHPVLKGLNRDGMKFWRGDNYVTRYEIRRMGGLGERAIVVSGGDNGLSQSAVVELSVGKGTVLISQVLLGEKFDSEPVARRILQNLLNYLADRNTDELKTLVITEDDKFVEKLSDIGLKYTLTKDTLNKYDLKNVKLLILHGGGEKISQSVQVMETFLKKNTQAKVYWHRPETKTFEAIKSSIGADKLKIAPQSGPVSINLREHELLAGISREDLLFIRSVSSWRRTLSLDPTVIDNVAVPADDGSELQRIDARNMELKAHKLDFDQATDAVRFGTRGTATGWLDVPETGMYMLSIRTGSSNSQNIQPYVEVKVGHSVIGHIIVAQEKMAEYQLLVELSAGRKEVQLSFLNGSEWDEGVEFLLNSIALRGKVKIPERAELLTLPMALVSLDAHKGKLIIDTITWDENQTNAIKANRYASALLANLGAEFKLPPLEDTTWLSVGPFELVGESPYYYKGTNHIELRSNGTIIASFECVKRGQYEIILRGYSTPIETDYAMAEIMIDSETAGRKEIASGTSSRFKLSPVVITKGRHKVSVRFTNDAYVERQDRNLFFEDLGFREFVPQENSER